MMISDIQKEINGFSSPGTLRASDFSKPRVSWRKTKLPAATEAMPLGWKRFFLSLEDGESLLQTVFGGAPQICDALSFPATVDFVLGQVAKSRAASSNFLEVDGGAVLYELFS